MADPLVVVTLKPIDSSHEPHTVRFRASDALVHFEVAESWSDLRTGERRSLLEDYALWLEKRRWGDRRSYDVNLDFVT